MRSMSSKDLDNTLFTGIAWPMKSVVAFADLLICANGSSSFLVRVAFYLTLQFFRRLNKNFQTFGRASHLRAYSAPK